eukprot:scaffold145606_cov35-Tisochrysis_lutea.AAC.3
MRGSGGVLTPRCLAPIYARAFALNMPPDNERLRVVEAGAAHLHPFARRHEPRSGPRPSPPLPLLSHGQDATRRAKVRVRVIMRALALDRKCNV